MVGISSLYRIVFSHVVSERTAVNPFIAIAVTRTALNDTKHHGRNVALMLIRR